MSRTLVKAAAQNFDLNQEQIKNASHIANEYTNLGGTDPNQLAYILATTYHESKFYPIEEIRASVGTPLRTTQDKYWLSGYYGRGFVQLTWLSNYKKFTDLLGIDLVTYPGEALQEQTAAKIINLGMINGLFTGVNLDRYINEDKVDFYNARKIVNGLDRASLINDYALSIINNIK